MIFLTYTLATVLLLFSIVLAPIHFRPVPTYLSWLLKNPFDWMAIRGLMPALILLLSFVVCVRTYLDPTTFWLKMTVICVALNVGVQILSVFWLYKMTKRDYAEYEESELKNR